MSAKRKLFIKNVKTVRRTKKQARVSSNSTCGDKKEDHKSYGCDDKCYRCGKHVSECKCDKKCCDDLFDRLKCDEDKLVKAIKCHDAKTIHKLIGCDCRIIKFYGTCCCDCVKVCCKFGKWHEISIVFDICIKRKCDSCNHC